LSNGRFASLVSEGLVITLSILLAFALDAWWDRHQDSRTGQELLESLTAEFSGVEAELLRARGVHEARGAAASYLVNLIDSGDPLPAADSLWTLLEATQRATTIDPPHGVLAEAISSGTLSLVADDSLRALLSGWDGRIADHEKSEQNHRGYIYEVLIPWRAENGVFPSLNGPTVEWRDRIDAVIRRPAHRGHLWQITDTGRLLAESDRLISESQTIQRLLASSGR